MNDRELASVIWLGLVAAFLLTRGGVLGILLGIARQAAKPVIFGPVLGLYAHRRRLLKHEGA
jgi:hypothetical protein